MGQLREEQKEALQVAKDYLVKLIAGMESVVPELKGDRREDTDEFLKQCLNGFNWTIQIYNRTSDLINEGKIRIVKTEVNKSILRFNEAMQSKNNRKVAEVLEKDIIVFLNNFSKAIDEVL